MPNLIHLQKDLILKVIRDKELAVVEIEAGKVKIFLENLILEKDAVTIPFEAVMSLGIIKKKINRELTLCDFNVNNNVVTFKIILLGSRVSQIENFLIKMISPLINKILKDKAPFLVRDNRISVDLSHYATQLFPTFNLELLEIGIFEDDINIVFN